jgi:L-threonylcarbamoyladenylate synthase
LKTEILQIDPQNIDMERMGHAACVIKSGGLVAFPTETVYGLGANALDQQAVKNIFEAKGRPADNPLIVHIAGKDTVKDLVSLLPPEFDRLADKFWPGPLTLIMPKSNKVPQLITAGLDTVAVRMPSHPVALALIRLSGLPIAAPSANTSGRPSPTVAGHVIEDLMGKVDIIIDAGSTSVGLESTVLDLTSHPPVILRPGGTTYEQLKGELKEVSIETALNLDTTQMNAPKSPGMKYTHYSPKAQVIIVEGNITAVVNKVNMMIRQYSLEGINAGVLATEQTKGLYNFDNVISLGDRNHPESIASSLFRSLRELDRKNVDVILAESIDNNGIGLAIMNRLNKAAGYNIIKA